jgi:uncharacterized protein (DUF58 family)
MPKLTPERILQRLDWQVIRRLDGILQGDYRSLFYGFGLNLADLREYQPGDDVRHIDWNVTARMATPYIRQYTEDREITAWFLLDLSPSVDFGTVESLKRDCLIDFAALLARLLTRHGNRVGAIFYNGQTERVIPASSGRLHVLRMVNDLLHQPHLPGAPLTDLSAVMATAYRIIRRRSLIFVVSDFISAPGWEGMLGLLNRRHEVLAVRLWDPREVDLPDMGLVVLQDSETGEQLLVDTIPVSASGSTKRCTGGQPGCGLSSRPVDVVAFDRDDLEAIVSFGTPRQQKQIACLA